MPQTFTPEELEEAFTKQPFGEVAAEPLMQKVVLTLLAASQKRTPVKTGFLRRSETTRVEAGGMRGIVGTNTVYAPFVHARQPFFSQAIEDTRPQIQKLLEDAGNKYFAKVVK